MWVARRIAIVIIPALALPMAVALGAEDGPAVFKGRVTDEASNPLDDARVVVSVPAEDMRFLDAGTTRKLLKDPAEGRRWEARTDAGGNFSIEIAGLSGRAEVSVEAMKPGYRRLSGTLMAGGDDRRLGLTPGTSTEDVFLVLKPALYFKGVVVDEQGKPIPSVDVCANAAIGLGSGGVERTRSRGDGTFELFNYPPRTDDLGKQLGQGSVSFSHPDYIGNSVEDMYALDAAGRESLRVVLPTGRRLSGTVLDNDGKPVAGAMVEASRKGGADRKATLSDAAGKFALRGLVGGISAVTARSLKLHQARSLPIALNGDRPDLEIQLRPMVLPADVKPQPALGMRLADVTPEIQSAYGLFNDRGAIILDPGKDSGRLAIGDLEEGNVFWMVGQTRVGSVREFVNQLLAEVDGPNVVGGKIRVVYSFRTVDFVGTNTQYMKLAPEHLKELKALAERLDPEPK